MSPRKSIYWLVAAACAGLLVCKAADDGSTESNEASPTTSPPVSLQATFRNGETVGVEQVRRAFLSHGTNRFVFVIPNGFRMDASNPQRIVLSDSNLSCFLSVRIVGSGRARPEYCRELLLRQHPGAKILDEFSQSAANCTGPAFDAQWEAVSGTTQSARVAYIPSSVGILEFSVLSKPDKFAQGKHFLNFLLLTFRSNESGSLDIPIFSDKS